MPNSELLKWFDTALMTAVSFFLVMLVKEIKGNSDKVHANTVSNAVLSTKVDSLSQNFSDAKDDIENSFANLHETVSRHADAIDTLKGSSRDHSMKISELRNHALKEGWTVS